MRNELMFLFIAFTFELENLKAAHLRTLDLTPQVCSSDI